VVTTRADALDQLELTLGRLLHAGVITSALCLAAGLVLSMALGRSAVASGALTMGLVILMATPIMRVVVSLVVYVRMRDWFFVWTTVMVFVLLSVTIFLAWTKAGI